MSLKSLLCIFMLLIVYIMSLGCCAPQNNGKVMGASTASSIPPVNESASIESYSAAEMCEKYSELIYTIIKDPISLTNEDTYLKVKNCHDVLPLIVNGTLAMPKEFPHMALLGHGKYVTNDLWVCSGSLISNRWIMAAAHCEKMSYNGNTYLAQWVRLGELNYASDTDDARPKDYKIDRRIVHPNYKPPSLYNDIALFHLEEDVIFSPYVRPICLNADTDPFFQSTASMKALATGWGLIENDGNFNAALLKVVLDVIPGNQCKSNYASAAKSQLPSGILDESQMCAGDVKGEKDTCASYSGGPLQIPHSRYTCMYTQIGVTSFGKRCAKLDSPDVYTRVSKYLPWIEQIVWPKSG